MNEESPHGAAVTPPGVARGRFQGVWQIVQYNQHFYLGGVAACALVAAGLLLVPLPNWLRVLVGLGTGVALFWLVASLAVSHYVYDLSPLYKWQWVAGLLPGKPQLWANIHAGLDESTLALRQLLGPEAMVLDIYNEQQMSEPSIKRARALTPPPVAAIATDYARLPVADAALDAVFLLFAAHEIRDARERLRFWNELHRVLRAGGVVVLAEHLRDAANFVAFGPGFLHFLPRREWLRLVHSSGFAVQRERSMTPFVRVLVVEKRA